jgi:acetyltransferase-like isoleucine patch superfamily enzyme
MGASQVWRRLKERGLRVKDLYSLYRILMLKLRCGRRVALASVSLGLERGSTVVVARRAAVRFGHLVNVRKGTDIEAHESATIEIGNRVFFGKDCTIVARARITIGDHCLFGENVSIYDHNHATSQGGVPFRDQGFVCRPITIGNNVWVGAKVFIRSGVSIGDNVIVGAGTVVTRNIPSNALAFSRGDFEIRPLAHRWSQEAKHAIAAGHR